jgi:putative ABC transport system permease protein
MTGLLQDLRYALRTFAKSPGFTAAAVLGLSLGIGLNTVMFCIVDSVLLRSLPYPHDEQLLSAQTVQKGSGETWATSPPDFRALREQNRTFASLASYFTRPLNLTAAGLEPERVRGLIVSSEFLEVLGIRPALGRGFLPGDEAWGSHQVAVLSDRLWRRRFGGLPSAIGETLNIDALPYTMVGVLPAGPMPLNIEADLLLPMSFAPGDNLNTRNNSFLTMVGRRRDGVRKQAAAADLSAIMAELERRFPENKGLDVSVTPLKDTLVANFRPRILVLMGAVGLVLLIACANLANLLLSRGVARRREIAIRTALGARRARLVAQLLTESLLLALAGGCGGLLLAVWGGGAVRLLAERIAPPGTGGVELDVAVLVFALAASLVTAAIFGVVPALEATRGSLSRDLNDERQPGGASGRRGARETTVIVEVALSLLLLIGSGLMLKSLHRLAAVRPGFEPRHVLTAQLAIPEEKYIDRPLARSFSRQSFARASQFFEAVAANVRGIPGVREVGLTSTLPLQGENWGKNVTFYDRPLPTSPRDLPPFQYRVVAGDLFRALGIPILKGRSFTASDRLSSPDTAIVSREFVRQYWNGQDPIGKVISVNPPAQLVPAGTLPPGYAGPEKFEVVGVAEDVHYGSLAGRPAPTVYVPYAQGAEGLTSLSLVVRTDGDPLAVAAAVRAEVLRVDPDQPLADVATMESRMGRAVAGPRLQTSLLGAFAGMAALLAAVGLYGVLSYAVSTRRREIGVRLALGATAGRVQAMVLKESLRLVGIGLACGLVGALALTRLLRSLLFEVSATDPIVYAVLAAFLAAVALLASLLPARRAARVDPMKALREA